MLNDIINISKTATVVSPALEFNLGMDLGSTETRFKEFDFEDPLTGEVLAIPSGIGIVGDISNVKSNSKKLEDVMEFLIKETTRNKTEQNLDYHFIKGNLINETRNVEIKRSSKVSKTLTEATYLDILVAITLQVIYKFNNQQLNYTKITPSLAIALPVAEASNLKTVEEFKKRLTGIYEVKMPRINLSLIIQIKKENIFVDAEPNCVQFYLASKVPELDELTTITIDGGGKSTDFSYAYEGVLNTDVGYTGTYGGNTLETDVLQLYLKETGASAPKQSQINKALLTGQLTRGINTEDIFNIIDEEKELLSKRIFDDILNVVNRADSSLEDINLFVFHGRLFTDTVTPKGIKSSLTEKVISQIIASLTGKNNKISTEVILDTSDITLGVILSKVSEVYAD